MPLTSSPTRADVAAKIPAHTYDRGGNRLTDFRETGSEPTREDADQAIVVADGIVRGRVGRIPDTADETDERWQAVAAMLIALKATRAAMELVRNIDQPEYERLRQEYADLLPDVTSALQNAIAGEDPSPQDDRPARPWDSFPAPLTHRDEEF